jgi:hypothetical protein
VADDELETRAARDRAQRPPPASRLLARYAMLVSEACDGAVLNSPVAQRSVDGERRAVLQAHEEDDDGSR